MRQDVSNQTVTILAILTIIISVLGAATVIYETSNYKEATQPTESKTTGTIRISIAEEPAKHSTQGTIQLNVKNNENS